AIAANRLRRQLLAAGIYPPLIRYPNGPAAQFFRFALSSEHREGQVAALESVLLAHLHREGADDGRR
ncbi:MAG: hypothetical protein IT580_00450, partial [Verrucomicrobiales bacterium]|nr:hypothetical protein [Verrucomicrobiales bacterium]